MALRWDAGKDPDEVLDFDLDWTARLDGDTIATSTWPSVTPSGLTVNSSSYTNTGGSGADSLTKVWLSGGTAGVLYTLLNRITTTGGRTMDQTVTLRVKAK